MADRRWDRDATERALGCWEQISGLVGEDEDSCWEEWVEKAVVSATAGSLRQAADGISSLQHFR